MSGVFRSRRVHPDPSTPREAPAASPTPRAAQTAPAAPASLARRDRLPSLAREVALAPRVAANLLNRAEPEATRNSVTSFLDRTVINPPKAKPLNAHPPGIKISSRIDPVASLATLEQAQLDQLAALFDAPTVNGRAVDRDALHAVVSQRLQEINQDRFYQFDFKEEIQKTAVFKSLPEAQQNRLQKLAGVLHLHIDEKPGKDPKTGEARTELIFQFGGTQNFSDQLQDFKTLFGRVGHIYSAAREAALLLSEVFKDQGNANRPGGKFFLKTVSGHSLGGGVGQASLATLQSRVELEKTPLLVLFDPQLLTNSQGRHAKKGGVYEYDFSKMRGVSITVVDDKVTGSLQQKMEKWGGYSSVGLFNLELRLPEPAADEPAPQRKPVVLPGVGYHAEMPVNAPAIAHFLRPLSAH